MTVEATGNSKIFRLESLLGRLRQALVFKDPDAEARRERELQRDWADVRANEMLSNQNQLNKNRIVTEDIVGLDGTRATVKVGRNGRKA